MAKILTSYHRPFIPIIRQLIAQGHEIISLQPQFAQEIKNLDLPCRSLVEFNNPDIQTAALVESAKLIHKAVGFSDGLEVDGLSDRIRGFIKRKELAGLLYPKVNDLSLLVLCLDAAKPDLALVHNDVEPLLRTAAMWCKENDKPCLHIPHAIYQNIENSNDIHSIITASHLASAGPYQTTWYTECGFPPENIAETGLPQFDDFADLTLDQQRSRSLLDLDPYRPVITYASSWSQNTNLLGMHDGISETYLAILECAKRLPDIQFVIKAHPRDRGAQWHLDKAKELNARVIITAHHLPIVLQASDVILAYGPSNILLEACHIPWLKLACTAGYDNDPQIMKINTDPPDIDYMIDKLQTALKMPPFDTSGLKRKYLGACDGHNSDRIVSLVEHLI